MVLVLQAVRLTWFVLHIWQRDPKKGFNKENYILCSPSHTCRGRRGHSPWMSTGAPNKKCKIQLGQVLFYLVVQSNQHQATMVAKSWLQKGFCLELMSQILLRKDVFLSDFFLRHLLLPPLAEISFHIDHLPLICTAFVSQ